MTQRIVSLVPSLTQTIAESGLKENIVGCTNFCVVPPDLHRKASLIGGPKDPDPEKIKALNPTHIFCNQEENSPAIIASCEELAPTMTTFPLGPRDVPDMLKKMDIFLGLESTKFAETASAIEQSLRDLAPRDRGTFLYFIWREPHMIASQDTYIDKCMDLMGYRNAWTKVPKDHLGRYPQIDLDNLDVDSVDWVFLSTEPFPFRSRHVDEFLHLVEGDWSRVRKIDGRLTQWYGSETSALVREVLLHNTVGGSEIIKEFSRQP